MKLKKDFFNKVCSKIDKVYFPDVKFYRDNKKTVRIHYALELFNNGVLGYSQLINELSSCTKDTKANIHKIIARYVTNFEGYEYQPK